MTKSVTINIRQSCKHVDSFALIITQLDRDAIETCRTVIREDEKSCKKMKVVRFVRSFCAIILAILLFYKNTMREEYMMGSVLE